MKINKQNFKESLTFLWIAIIFFLATINIIFPFVMFMMKVVFYIFGLLMFILAISTMFKSIFGKTDIPDEK